MAHEGEYLLSGNVEDGRDAEIEQLSKEVQRLEHELLDARQASKKERAAIIELRRQLAPLYGAFQAVFGVIDATVRDAVDARSSAQEHSDSTITPRERVVWESWKQKLGRTASKVIDALLLHGELNTQQLAIATGLHRTTVPEGIYKLNKAGLINKNGGSFSLKKL